MITYRYGPYQPEEEGDWNLDRLMGILSDMVMKYNIQLDEALRMLIDRGLPVNMFIREGGMDDMISRFQEQIQEQRDEILENFHLKDAIKEVEKSRDKNLGPLRKGFKKQPELRDALDEAVAESSLDQLFRIKWGLTGDKSMRGLQSYLEKLQKDIEDEDTIRTGEQKFRFRGDEGLDRDQALTVLKNLEELENLMQSLQQAQQNGDFFDFNLENLARYLGPESYQEFLEKREEIFEKLKQLLENNGMVVENEETGEMSLSPAAIRKIGKQALLEIFSNLRPDSSGGSIDTDESGESDNLASKTRPLEYGDSIANIDIPASMINAIVRTGQGRPSYRDVEVFEPRGSAKSSTVVLLDMSGSMMRANRFYHAKQMVLALDSLIREEYRDERMMVVGFGTLAKFYSPAEIPTLQPFNVTMFDPHIRLRFDMSDENAKSRQYIPEYFTNLQRGLQLSRTLLGSGEAQNKQIILVTDGVPTAHFEGSKLHINYPPSPGDFEAALREVRECTDNNIVINTFLLTSDWEMSYFGEESFITQFAKQSMGRIFYPHPNELNQIILVDFINNKKKLIKT